MISLQFIISLHWKYFQAHQPMKYFTLLVRFANKIIRNQTRPEYSFKCLIYAVIILFDKSIANFLPLSFLFHNSSKEGGKSKTNSAAFVHNKDPYGHTIQIKAMKVKKEKSTL